jgi:Fe-S-cluster containining protein
MSCSHTIRLAILGASPCHLCNAACCRQNGHEFAVLLQGDDERRRFAAFSAGVTLHRDDGLVVERVLPYRDGQCPFLGDDDRCTIYVDRPAACRAFECAPRFNEGGVIGAHGAFLRRNPRVLRTLALL